ncbi:uncharacterized protein LOC129572304 [Sitodiplosis mosellana]|uniref:uncharacterized protein LOC129572304 n=1 Tax=Sitodiplosis mosellana TaxID=263140 RepID=UPI002444F7B1|nr:uncharacterized protein LOC129572304 [Sitodiplosis mosellana]
MSTNDENILSDFPWITSLFVQKLLDQSEQSKDVNLKSFIVKRCFNEGEGFSSNMLCLKTTFHKSRDDVVDTKHTDFIFKIALQTEEFDKLFEEGLYFEKEIFVYSTILPKLKHSFEVVGMTVEIGPRYFMGNTQQRILILEDMRVQQFKGVDLTHGLDMDHMKLTVATLAKWHAGTANLLLTNPDIFTLYAKNTYQNAPCEEEYFKNVAKILSDTVRNWPGYGQLAEKLDKIPQTAYDNAYKAFEPQANGFNVITHGDMYINNLLFRYDDNGNPIDVRFIDFAFGKRTSPSIDLILLLYSSSHSSISQSDREYLVEYYHSELVKCLQLLNYSGHMPTLFEMQSTFFGVDLYNALAVLFIIGIRYKNTVPSDGSLEVANSSEKTNDDNTKLYSNPEYIKHMKYLLEIFERRGYFEF